MRSTIDSKGASARVLVADDSPDNIAVLVGALESEGHEVLTASSGLDALKITEKARPELILLDILMPGLDGIEICRRLKSKSGTDQIPVIFITGQDNPARLVEAFQAGGVDYILKPFQLGEVMSRVGTHLRLSRLTQELAEKNRALEEKTRELVAEAARRRDVEAAFHRVDETLTRLSDLESERWNVAGLIGRSDAMRVLVEHIHRLHQFPGLGVLITGESGTGKELIARAIHFGSPRARAPFVPVNCVAIPAELAESMMFGHVKGAFTGATSDRKGYFQMADGGTLFLDEVGDMPAALQVKLLRVLEDGMVMPVGGTEARHVDVRVVAATNADLESRIEAGTFRSDLYFRLARYRLETVPLRGRAEDIDVLAAHFLNRFATEMNLASPSLSAEARAALASYDFPGNVRELKNIVERAVIDSGGVVIQVEHLCLPKRREKLVQTVANAVAVLKTAEPVSGPREEWADLPLNLAAAEDALIQRALQQTGGNIADAARLLGVHRTRIYRKLSMEGGKVSKGDDEVE
jgi:DNA-binding NtrC family response regulator